jgi:hypothetical protein
MHFSVSYRETGRNPKQQQTTPKTPKNIQDVRRQNTRGAHLSYLSDRPLVLLTKNCHVDNLRTPKP